MSTSEARGRIASGELSRVAWRTSSRSNSNGAMCVEAGPLQDTSGRVAVRHSHHPHDEIIVYDRGEWDAFTAGIKHGEFDF